jgi:NADH dehydrogenase FAD-containing subunit
MSEGRHQVVVVGGGFGGVRVTTALARADVDITIVDRTNHHLFQPLLYQLATGILPDGLIAPALRGVVRKVEMVGQVAELAHEALPREYRSVATTEATILLIEAGLVEGVLEPALGGDGGGTGVAGSQPRP